MAKRRIGPFEIERKLGGGGMGVVYLATYLKTGQKVALKVLSPALSTDNKLRARFEREMEILKKLRDPHIVRYYGGGAIDGQHFYAMEYVDGGTVEDLIKERGRLSWEQTIEIARDLCQALEHAHNVGIIHRDLKPANLFLTKAGVLKIGDFGIAQDTQATALTAPGCTVGTYAYMAPEQITGKQPVSRKTDLYALGCVMYQMLTGRTPFQANSMPDMLMAHLKEQPDRLTTLATDCPVWLEALIQKLMEKDPEDRYYDALAVQIALDDVGQRVASQKSIAAATQTGGKTAAPGTPQNTETAVPKKRKKRKKTGPFYERVWFLALCLFALIGLVAWSVWPMSEDRLYQEAKTLMASENFADWRTAREKYIEPLLTRFPESVHVSEAQGWIDRIEMDLAERQMNTRLARNREPDSAAEAKYVEARKFETFGDLATAENLYGQMDQLFAKRPEDRPFLLLARRQRERIHNAWRQSQGSPLTSQQFVREKLRKAERHFLETTKDERVEAEEIWRDLIQLYGFDPRFDREVNYARQRLERRDVPPLEEWLAEPHATTNP